MRLKCPDPSVLGIVTIAVALLLNLPAHGSAPAASDPFAVNRAKQFLETRERGRYITEFLHFGSQYSGHSFDRETAVTDSGGRTLPGEFALVYTLWWDGDGWTEVAFFFDAKGEFTNLRPLGTNANFNQPFLKANLAVAVVGNLVLEVFKDDMSEADRREFRQLVDGGNSQGLLEMGLQYQQALGK